MSADESKQVLEDLVNRLRRRLRLRDVVLLAGRGAFAGAIAALAVATLAMMIGGPEARSMIWLCAALCPCAALVGAALGGLRWVDPLAAARALDREASSDDRFASALQLAGHRRQERAALLLKDALESVRGSTAEAAIPLKAPRELRWFPLPVIAFALLAWLSPKPLVHAVTVVAPEVSPEEWTEVARDFKQELERLPKPQTREEQELADALRRLVSLFERNPSKKDALAEIARLQDALDKQRAGLGVPDASLRQAAAAIQSSAALNALASALRSGEYRQAAQELRKLAEQLKENTLKLSAADFESIAADFERMAEEIKSMPELSQACQASAGAAASMNREKLAESCSKLAQSLDRNSDRLRQCDRLCRSRSLLDGVKRRLSQCKTCCSSCSGKGCKACKGGTAGFVKRSERKGGSKAGRGTAGNWGGGQLGDDIEQRVPLLAETPENAGADSRFSTLSPEERAESAQDYKQLYADLVRKAEADLALESVPPAYREYLRRYFVSIKPSDDVAEGKAGPDG